MCGIVAVLSRSRVSGEGLTGALDAMRRRGPDGQDAWWDETGSVGLGHTRLAIHSPATGGQPFHWGPDQRFVAVVNGELYGARVPFQGSDSWLLAEAWEQHGFPALLDHLRGEFAWVAYDRQTRRLYAARDRFGIKPLFLARSRGALWLASKPTALWGAGLPAGWSAKGFWRASATQYPPLGGSLFEGISELPPAHWLCVDATGQETTGRYWRPPIPRESTTHEPVEELYESLREAVHLRVYREGRTAVMLSGGIDSASVLALAQESIPAQPLHAFSVDFPDSGPYSERKLAEQQSAHSGVLQHTVISLSATDLVEGLEESARGALGLMVNAHGVAKYQLARAIQQAGIRVVLTGEGADELLYGYRHFDSHLPHSQRIDPLADPAGLGILTSRQDTAALAEVERTLGFRPHIWVFKWQLGQRIQSFLSRDFLATFAAQDPFVDCLEEVAPAREGGELTTVRDLWLATALRAYILEVLGDGCEMAHSVEGRPPFLDHVLWERVACLPLPLLCAPPGKALLRQAMGDRLAPALRLRPKHPFMAPPLGRPLLEALAARLDEPHPFVDRRRALANLEKIGRLEGADAWEWEPALIWILSSYHLQGLWSTG